MSANKKLLKFARHKYGREKLRAKGHNTKKKKLQSAHACSEIGLKWFLFALHVLGTALNFVSVLDFFGDFVFLEHRRNGQNGIKTIFDHFRNTHALACP
jgi:hypothetical protein